MAGEAVQVSPEQQEHREVPEVSWLLSPAAKQAVGVVVVQELVTKKSAETETPMKSRTLILKSMIRNDF